VAGRHVAGAAAHLVSGEGRLTLINDCATVLDDLLDHA
jgi:hypothetical protein